MMQVSIALHRAEPRVGGNQRESECEYMNYNRRYATLDNDGHCVIDTSFPAMGETIEHWVAQYFSVGICEGVPNGCGGEILNYAPLYEPVPVRLGAAPAIKAVMKIDRVPSPGS